MPTLPVRILLLFWEIREIASMDRDQGGEYPQYPWDWEMPRPWKVFRHISNHIYWIRNFARNLAIVQKLQGGVFAPPASSYVPYLLSLQAGDLAVNLGWKFETLQHRWQTQGQGTEFRPSIWFYLAWHLVSTSEKRWQHWALDELLGSSYIYTVLKLYLALWR